MTQPKKLTILEQCSLQDCRKTVHCKGYCSMHYQRIRNHGDPTFTKATPTQRANRRNAAPLDLYGLPAVGYKGVHNRLRAKRGRAANYTCPCGAPARDWSFPHDLDTDQVIWENLAKRGELPLRWSKFTRNIWAYVPKCSPCHHREDNQYRREAMA